MKNLCHVGSQSPASSALISDWALQVYSACSYTCTHECCECCAQPVGLRPQLYKTSQPWQIVFKLNVKKFHECFTLLKTRAYDVNVRKCLLTVPQTSTNSWSVSEVPPVSDNLCAKRVGVVKHQSHPGVQWNKMHQLSCPLTWHVSLFSLLLLGTDKRENVKRTPVRSTCVIKRAT
jgi:hypothetical protein